MKSGMNHRVKLCIMSLVLITAQFGSCVYADNSNLEPSVVLEGQKLQTDATPEIINSRLMLPASVIFRALGAEVGWNGDLKTISAFNKTQSIQMTIGKSEIVVNGKIHLIDVAPYIKNGRVMVPVGVISTYFDKQVSWDDASKTASIFTKVIETAQYKINVGLQSLYIGMSENQVISQLGEAMRKEPSEKGFTWFIYNGDLKNYVQVGMKNGAIVAIFTNAQNFRYGQIGKNTLKSEIDLSEATLLSEGLYRKKAHVLQMDYFFDLYDRDKLTAVYMLDETAASENDRDYLSSDQLTSIKEAFAREIFDLANSERIQRGLGLLTWDDRAAAVARSYSEDMSRRDFFDHYSPEGTSPYDRMKAANIGMSIAAENIAEGYENAIYSHEAWMNSEGHRSNILAGDLTHLGVGVQLNSETLVHYFTEDFYTPK